MKNNVRIVFGLVFMSLFAGLAVAQEDRVVSSVGSIYVISAKAGGVSYVEGKVSVVRKEGKSGLLIKDDQIEVGDRVSTGPDSKAEILLNPGSYLRLGANTSFEFLTTSLDDLKLKLHGGSAVVEVLASMNSRSRSRCRTPASV
ncbi:MAG: FecR domain-containing protein [Acidobacteria bacterium]|nr:FecR domain-containing protein [Acidobacteriota bacterium]